MLRAGGNAADAAVAVATTLGVVEPSMSGLGGDAFYLVYMAATRKATVINASGPAPAAATVERFAGGIPQAGIRSVSVPCALEGWLALHGRFGSRPLPDLFAAAIAHARDGFGATRHFCNFVAETADALRGDPAAVTSSCPTVECHTPARSFGIPTSRERLPRFIRTA